MVMKILKKVLTIGCCIGHQLCLGQADVHFSQFYESSILRNPALTGVFEDDYKVQSFYRSQWYAVSNPYNTFTCSGEAKMPVGQYSKDFVSFGLLFYQDKAGTGGQQILAVYPTIAYNKSLSSDFSRYLSFGVSAAYSQYSFDPSRVTFNSQYQGGAFNTSLPAFENIAGSKVSMWNLAAGLNFNSSSDEHNTVVYCVGLSGYNLTSQPLSYLGADQVTLNIRGNMNASVAIALREDVNIQIHGNYARQGSYSETAVGFLWSWSRVDSYSESDFSVALGGVYRYKDAVAPVVRLKYHKVALAASYDINTSSFSTATGYQGGFECVLSFSGALNPLNAAKKTLCPRF